MIMDNSNEPSGNALSLVSSRIGCSVYELCGVSNYGSGDKILGDAIAAIRLSTSRTVGGMVIVYSDVASQKGINSLNREIRAAGLGTVVEGEAIQNFNYDDPTRKIMACVWSANLKAVNEWATERGLKAQCRNCGHIVS